MQQAFVLLKTGNAIEAIIRDIEGFFHQQSFRTLTPGQAQKIGDLRQGLADQHRNLVATNEAWRTWRRQDRLTISQEGYVLGR